MSSQPDDEEPQKPWLPSATVECPVDPATQRWIEASFSWFGDEFGTAILNRDPMTPDEGPQFEAAYSASAEQIRAVVTLLCEQMMVDPKVVTLELFDGSAEKKEADKTGRRRAVGHFRQVDGRPVIALDRGECDDLNLLVAIAVHELCHVRLLGEGRIGRDRSDGERLTDLLTVYFGFGILTTNAAIRFARAQHGWTAVSRGSLDDRSLNAARNEGYRRLGYLSSAEFGYALACYCWSRREKEPSWTRYVNPGPRVHLEQGLAYLARGSADGELPAQRLLGKTVKIGNVSIRVTRGTKLGPGSFIVNPAPARAAPPP